MATVRTSDSGETLALHDVGSLYIVWLYIFVEYKTRGGGGGGDAAATNSYLSFSLIVIIIELLELGD
jgi:hypothetical protein